MPRGQQCVFDQAPGVLPVRRETIEGIDGCGVQRMPLDGVHSAGLRPFGRQLRLGPGGSTACPRWWPMQAVTWCQLWLGLGIST